MRNYIKKLLLFLFLLHSIQHYSQHDNKIIVELNNEKKTLNIQQEITFYNQSPDTISSIILNDWNNAYSSKNTPLANRFSDEFYRGFHLAKEFERGNTNNITIIDQNNLFLNWERTNEHPDLLCVQFRSNVYPNQKIKIYLTYVVKIPSDKFTNYGFNNKNQLLLKNWFLTPSRFENHLFTSYSNNNIDDIPNGLSNFEIEFKVPNNLELTSDLDHVSEIKNSHFNTFNLKGTNRVDINILIEPKTELEVYKNDIVEVATNLKDNNLTGIEKAVVIDRVTRFVNDFIGKYPHSKILITQNDYEKNPFYGLNQLPDFISPFPNEFTFEIKFLKSYLNAFLKNSLQLDQRKDNWIFDGIQVYAMMKYIDENHPEMKMLGNLSKLKIFKSYNLTKIDFNDQYSYFYMMMARKNLDQPLSDPKNTLIKFNEQIASKYRAGLSFKYLDDYLGQDVINNSIKDLFVLNNHKQISRNDFETIIKSKTTKNINWFFNTIIDSREIIDYKFSSISKTKDSVSFSIKNDSKGLIPIPIYGIKKGQIVFKDWLEPQTNDTIFKLSRRNADKIVINYKNEVPEYNLRNNWKSLKGFSIINRPIKFNFIKDMEDPYYNQIFYVPEFAYNLYDGISPGISIHNKSLLDKKYTFDFTPIYSTKTKSLIGSAYFNYNQNIREDVRLYNIKYILNGSTYHYAPNAAYVKFSPTIVLKFRDLDFRKNIKETLVFRQIIVDRQKSSFMTLKDENYSIFNVSFSKSEAEITKVYNFISDVQLAKNFGKIAGEIQIRKLFEDNRRFNFRLYAGKFMYKNTDSDFYNFSLDRPTDYLFDYGLLGRSESTGLFSQQYVMAEGGFKSKLATRYLNDWIATTNLSLSIWNWVEMYADFGIIKNKGFNSNFVHDNGIRLNLVPDYFELYFPVYSNNGWEISQTKYDQKIRFVITLNPKTLVNLFTRKWF